MNDTNPTRRGTVLPYRAVIVPIWMDSRAKSDATFRKETPRGGFGPESPLIGCVVFSDAVSESDYAYKYLVYYA